MNKWDLRFIKLARHISQWSKDPSTKVGAVIVDENNRIISLGFNGFPRGLDDSEQSLSNRDLKIKTIIHAEENAILFAKQDLSKCRIYIWPLMSCSTCTSKIIQSGIGEVIACNLNTRVDWEENFKISRKHYENAGISFREIRHFTLDEKNVKQRSYPRSHYNRKSKPPTKP